MQITNRSSFTGLPYIVVKEHRREHTNVLALAVSEQDHVHVCHVWHAVLL
jgi:hypothetical protein